jgi:hypothetical protein
MLLLCVLTLASGTAYHCLVSGEDLKGAASAAGGACLTLDRGGDTLARVISGDTWDLAVVTAKDGKAVRLEGGKVGSPVSSGSSSVIYRLTIVGAGQAAVGAAVSQFLQAAALLPAGALSGLLGGEAPLLGVPASSSATSDHVVG